MSSLKETRIFKSLAGKGGYIALAAVFTASAAAGAAVYGRALRDAGSREFSLSTPDGTDISIPENVPAEKKQQGVARNESSAADSSSADSSSVSEKRTAPDIMPVNGEILEPFSRGELVKSSTLGIWKTHDGVDIAAKAGTPVRAMNSGEVTSVTEDPLWGYTVIIDHGSGLMGYYYNLTSAVTVSEGDKVQSGQTIGAVGESAEIEAAMQTHLHFGLKKNGEWIDPLAYINHTSGK